MKTQPRETTSLSSQKSEPLQQAEAELARIETLLIEAELRLATHRQQIAVFEQGYRRVAAGLCEELDRLNTQINALCANRFERHHRPGRSRARTDYETIESSPDEFPELPQFRPSESLAKLYREAAKRFHPDLTQDETDREWRHQMMQQANAAFAAGDCETLQRLLDANPSSHSLAAATDPSLAAIKARITRLRSRLEEVLREHRDIETSDLGQLYSQAKKSGHGAAIFLRNLVVALKAEIDEKQDLLKDLLSMEPNSERRT